MSHMGKKQTKKYSPNAFGPLDHETFITLLQNAGLCRSLLWIDVIGSKDHWINTVKVYIELVTRAWL